MKKGWVVFLVLMMLLLVSAITMAAPKTPAVVRSVNSTMDANGDGVITVAEHAAFWQGRYKDIDKDKDGKLTAAEFATATNEFFGNMDQDKDGVLVAKEYIALWCGPKALVPKDITAAPKKKLDANKDGKIADDECVVFWSANFFDVDSNHDGKITMDEFTAGMSKRFKEIDKDRNGYVSIAEHSLFRSNKVSSAKKSELKK